MTKNELRRQFLTYRRLLGPDAFADRNERVVIQLKTLFESLKPNVVHIFLAIARNNEPDVKALIQWMRDKSIRIMISRTDFESRQMKHYWYDSDVRLSENHLDIPEPISGNQAEIGQADVILVPLLAVDRSGHRLGYGGGYYDRLLADSSRQAQTIGLHLAPPVNQLGNIEGHDIPLDFCVCPNETIYFHA